MEKINELKQQSETFNYEDVMDYMRVKLENLKHVKITGFATDSKNKEITILYHTPRKFRHPEEYGGSPEGWLEFEKEEDRIMDIASETKQLVPGLVIDMAEDVSGPNIKKYSY